MADKSRLRIWDFLVIFAIVYLGYQLVFKMFFPVDQALSGTVNLTMKDDAISVGTAPIVVIHNDTDQPLNLVDRCPKPPVDVLRVEEGNKLTDITTDTPVTACVAVPTIESGKKIEVDLSPWKPSTFNSVGLYELELPWMGPSAIGTGAVVPGADNSQYREGVIVRFTINEPGVIVKLFRAFITKPILNALIFVASLTPGHDLGMAIIIVTLLVKLLLFIPTQHALEGQKKMQLLQPKLEEIRRTHKDDAVKMQQETMKLWKEHKVNPFQSCLPLLVQFPILIGLFYVVRDGYHLELSRHMIYSFYQNLGWNFDTSFLGLDLTRPYVWLFPPLLVVLQFIQMKLTFMIADKKQAKKLEAQTTKAIDTPQEMQQRIMLYGMPLIIGFFAINFPSAVSLYWGISTLFAIGQQLIVNREHIRP